MLFRSHAENSDESVKLMSTGYLCPQCLSKHCELPVECRACGLTLVSAPHLARSYHYLFPVEPFKEFAYEGEHSVCFGCQKTFSQRDKKVMFVPFFLHIAAKVFSLILLRKYLTEKYSKFTCATNNNFIREDILCFEFSNIYKRGMLKDVSHLLYRSSISPELKNNMNPE